jgi:hypothetical protein
MILGVPLNACNDAVYGELGRYPLFVNRYVQIIKYWFHIIHSDNIILKLLYRYLYEESEKGVNNWAKKVKCLLDEYGFSDIWLNPYHVDPKWFISCFKQRVIDCFCQKWFEDIKKNSVLNTLYVNIKTSFDQAFYLKKNFSKSTRKRLTGIRISSHNLRIHSGRYGRDSLPRENRKCQICNSQDIEDEFHFIIVCKYENTRKKYVKKFNWNKPSMISRAFTNK